LSFLGTSAPTIFVTQPQPCLFFRGASAPVMFNMICADAPFWRRFQVV